MFKAYEILKKHDDEHSLCKRIYNQKKNNYRCQGIERFIVSFFVCRNCYKQKTEKINLKLLHRLSHPYDK